MQELLEKSHRLYANLRRFWFVLAMANVVTLALSLIASQFLPFPFFLPTFQIPSLIGILLAWPGVNSWYKRSRALLALDSDEAKLAEHRAIWQAHSNWGILVSVGAGVLILFGFMLIQVPPAGWLILAAIYGGAFVHFKANRLETQIRTAADELPSADAIGTAESSSASEASASEINPYAPKKKSTTSNASEPADNKKRFWTAGKRAWLWVGLGLAIPVTFIVILITPPPSFSEDAGKSERVITEMSETVPADWAFGGISGSSYGPAYNNPNSRFFATRESNEPDFAEGCKELIAWGVELGAEIWYHDPSYFRVPIIGNETRAQIACVYTMSMAEIDPAVQEPGGSSTFLLAGRHKTGDLIAPFLIELNVSSQPAATPNYLWNVGVSTTYQEDSIGLDNLSEQEPLNPELASYLKALDAFGAYRLAHPELEYFDENSFTEASTGLSGLSIKPIVSEDGLVRLAELKIEPASQTVLPLCVSLEPWSKEFAGVPDPGSGYTIGYLQTPGNLNHFGRALAATCPAAG